MNRRKNQAYPKLIHYYSSSYALIAILIFLVRIDITSAGNASSTTKDLFNQPTTTNLQRKNEVFNTTRTQSFNEYQSRTPSTKAQSEERQKPASSGSAGPAQMGPIDSILESLSELVSPPTAPDFEAADRKTRILPPCRGRDRLERGHGYLSDGLGFYQTNLQCSWLIDGASENATIRLKIHQFNTECSFDYLYVFDGDSIYSPLVAAISGDMKDFSSAILDYDERISSHIDIISNTEAQYKNDSSQDTSTDVSNQSKKTSATLLDHPFFEIKTTSGKAFVYFHSDTAQSMPGFYITYTVNACPLDCSDKGECDFASLTCTCERGYTGPGCQYVSCPNNCTSPIHGSCMNETCVCNPGFTGQDCSLNASGQQLWTRQDRVRSDVEDTPVHYRAFHKAVVVEDIMWIIGGRSRQFNSVNTELFEQRAVISVTRYDLTSNRWIDANSQSLTGVTGIDHLAELSGHSAVATGHKIFIYGGLAPNNTILDTLTVLDTQSMTTSVLKSINNNKTIDKGTEMELMVPIAAVGHSANVVDKYMYVFLGYNPLYGYLNFVQRFNLATNTWSILGRRGSPVSGSVGHTSTNDPQTGLIFVYGGHNDVRISNLYSFDPQTHAWTLLQSGSSTRFYHSALALGRQLVLFGGLSYDTAPQSDQCFRDQYLVYNIDCHDSINASIQSSAVVPIAGVSSWTVGKRSSWCRNCWQSVGANDEPIGVLNVLKRHGHSVIEHKRKLILYGGYNGVLLHDVHALALGECAHLTQQSECSKFRLGLTCLWDAIEGKCDVAPPTTPSDRQSEPLNRSRGALTATHASSLGTCDKLQFRSLQKFCETRETCTSCLTTNAGCVWCDLMSQCQFECSTARARAVTSLDQCYRNDSAEIFNSAGLPSGLREASASPDMDLEYDCKQIESCDLCNVQAHCTWDYNTCAYTPSGNLTPQMSSGAPVSADLESSTDASKQAQTQSGSSNASSTDQASKQTPFQLMPGGFAGSSSPRQSCDAPCYMRRSCNQCTSRKCIWCSTSDQCIDSSAYFAYHSMGQCMHYVAHFTRCSAASCRDIETCDKCLTNPRCGWLNDVSNTGKGKCMDGNSAGPLTYMVGGGSGSTNNSTSSSMITRESDAKFKLKSEWYYSSCPACQCSGHSYCADNKGACVQPCQDNTEGPHCDRCSPGYYGNPTNGGSCEPCKCNGHAQSCNRETGKCYCSTKGIVGHNCDKCDEQNHYIGNPDNGTCYYNLTTDYQYTFNMSKPEDHFYRDINFINVPIRKDSDVDFTIACSRLAMVNITAGPSYRARKSLHSSLECGQLRLRFTQDKQSLAEANYSLFVHVYQFQTPFILQIAFSQHRTLYIPEFFGVLG